MSATYKIDDSIVYETIDNLLASIDIDDLIKVKYELLKNKEDTSIIDKAINERRKRDKIKAIKESEEIKRNRRILLLALLNGLKEGSNTTSDLMPWEEDALKSGYEDFNFEEEELEEDDYYFEDDK